VARVLAMSSWVSAGHVGLSAMAPILQSFGHEIIQLPTVVLSNHTCWPAIAGRETPPDQLTEMLDANSSNGWLAGVDTFLGGYLPSVRHVEVARQAIDKLLEQSPVARIVCDPVLGDDPEGLFIAHEAAEAVRDRFVPLADTLTPNRYELAWLTGRSIHTIADARLAAQILLEERPGRRVLVTSPPISGEETGVLEVSADDAHLYRTQRRKLVPKGVGDVFSALVGAGLSTGAALGHLQALIDSSIGAPHLAIADDVSAWRNAAPVPYKKI
jgi:pyridoxine kinase